jgi:hypothetical protein
VSVTNSSASSGRAQDKAAGAEDPLAVTEHGDGRVACALQAHVGQAVLEHVMGRLRVLVPATVAYLDIIGGHAETIAHSRENGRIVVLSCAFAGLAATTSHRPLPARSAGADGQPLNKRRRLCSLTLSTAAN